MYGYARACMLCGARASGPGTGQGAGLMEATAVAAQQECSQCRRMVAREAVNRDASIAIGELVCVACASQMRIDTDEQYALVPTNEEDMAKMLIELLMGGRMGDADLLEELAANLLSADTFADAGMMTRSAGVVLRFSGGLEYALTIQKTRNSR